MSTCQKDGVGGEDPRERLAMQSLVADPVSCRRGIDVYVRPCTGSKQRIDILGLSREVVPVL